MPEPLGPIGPVQGQPQGPAPGGPLPEVPANIDALIEEIGAKVEDTKPTAEEIREEEKALEESVQYDLTPEQKQEIVEHIIKVVDDAIAARSGWLDIRKECVDLLNGVRKEKTEPWPNCSNVTTMATTTHCKLIHSRLFPTGWNENLIYWTPIEKADVDNVEKVSKFMGWVVRQDLNMQDRIDDIIWDLITNGTIALKTRWIKEFRTVAEKDTAGKLEYKEVVHERCEVDNISIDEVYLPDLWKGVDDSEFIAQDVYMRLPEIEDLAERGAVQGADIETTLEPQMNEMAVDSLGLQKKDIEGSTAVISAHKNSMPVRLIECYIKWKIKGELKESVFLIGYNSKTYLSGKPLSAVSPIGKRPWIIGQLMRRTGRPYGIGFPEMMRGLAKELDAIHNQRIDAGAIAIAPFGFYRAASSFRPAKVQIGPGTMIPVDDIQDVNVVQLQHNPIASFQEERIIVEYIEKLTSVSAYQMGRESDIVKSRATAHGTMALISQGEQAFSILGIRCQKIISSLLSQILQQYQMWMPSGYAKRILGEDAGDLLFSEGLSPEEIAGRYDAYMALDSTVGNKAMERQANQVLVQMAPNLLAMAQDPRGYEIAAEFLKSIGKIEVEKYLGPKPEAQPQGANIGAFGQGQGAGAGAVGPEGGGAGGQAI